MRLIALFNLKPGIDRARYEAWARETDLPTVNALPSIDKFEVYRIMGVLGSETPSPYAYVETLDVSDMERFGVDCATDVMQTIAAAFQEMAEVTFLTTEQLV